LESLEINAGIQIAKPQKDIFEAIMGRKKCLITLFLMALEV